MSISIIGFILLAFIMLPNIAFMIWPSVDAKKTSSSVWDIVEHVGRIASMVFLCLNFNARGLEISFASKAGFVAWMIITALITGLYIGIWMRYFLCGRTNELCFKSFFIPMPLVILPVLDFLVTGVFCMNYGLIASSIILGLGHIKVSLKTRKELSI